MTDTKIELKNLIECACKRSWPTRFGHLLLFAESFVDPACFHGPVYRAANWIEVRRTRGRDGQGYTLKALTVPRAVSALSSTNSWSVSVVTIARSACCRSVVSNTRVSRGQAHDSAVAGHLLDDQLPPDGFVLADTREVWDEDDAIDAVHEAFPILSKGVGPDGTQFARRARKPMMYPMSRHSKRSFVG